VSIQLSIYGKFDVNINSFLFQNFREGWMIV